MESWLILLDVIIIVCFLFAIIFGLIFLLIIIFDKTCRTVPVLLVGNTCLALFLFGFVSLGLSLFVLHDDLKGTQSSNSLCHLLGYFNYATATIFNCTFIIQALYRYVIVVYPARPRLRSGKTQILLISCTWILGFLLPIYTIIRNGEIVYDVDNHICHAPVQLSFTMIYLISTVYVIPDLATAIIYLKLVLHVHQMSKRVATANVLFHAQRELTMVRRTIIVVLILVASGLPYLLFVIMSSFTSIYKYHLRISFASIAFALALVIIPIFQFTEPLKIAILKRFRRQITMTMPAVQ